MAILFQISYVEQYNKRHKTVWVESLQYKDNCFRIVDLNGNFYTIETCDIIELSVNTNNLQPIK